MKNYAASVRAKLKNQARVTGKPLNLLELHYVQERFLYRLSQSKYKDQFILKGGILFYVWSDFKYRSTRDLDFMFYGNLDRNELLEKIIDICRLQFPEDGIEFQWDTFSYEMIKENHEYEGARINFTAIIGTSRIKMKLDICTGDKITPEPQEYSFPKIFTEHNFTKLKMYPKETVIAEKVHAMISLDLANSRMKDYFDVFILISDFSNEIDRFILANAISITFSHRNTQIPIIPARILSEYFYEDRSKIIQWNAFLKRNKISNKYDLKDVCLKIGDYINPVFNMLFKK
jgi:predicted nucleotidyltransferase component of viral defense system